MLLFWNRHIMDNVLIAYKLVHALRSKRSGREGYIVMKLDMSKAYDRVINNETRYQILKASSIQTVASSEKYLGFPTMVGRSKYRTFNPSRTECKKGQR